MKISTKQKMILYGLVLGDAYLQPTGRLNARLRLEHSLKQNDYVNWKYDQLKNLFQTRPKRINRVHPKTKKTYSYLRLQSHASPFLGELRKMLYSQNNNNRQIIKGLDKLLKTGITLAVWYMDDGYYDKRDKSAHIYLPKLKEEEIIRLIRVLEVNFGLRPNWYCRPDKESCQLNFTGQQKDMLIKIIKPYIIPSLRYKLPLTP